MKTFQSARDAGEKSFVPMGQLFFWVDLRTSKQLLHLISILAEYLPVRAMFSQTQPFGLPGFGFKDIFASWQ
jgi:hypothetical protein